MTVTILSAVFGWGIAQNKFVVDVAKPISKIQPTMWGVFFEDINFGADGGLYAELIKNRSFEFIKPLMGWEVLNGNNEDVLILNRVRENPKNPRFAHISIKQGQKPLGLSNEGFRAMGVKQGVGYSFSLQARVKSGQKGMIRGELVGADGSTIGNASLEIAGTDWKTYKVEFKCSKTDPKAHFIVWFEKEGTYDVDMISLFPQDTWKGRPGGLRRDLVQLLADMKPGFIRFPGGCIVEGRNLANRYQWKNTVGPIDQRQVIMNRWNTEFAHKPTPDYFQSFGLGFYEYFQLAEDIGAEPLPIINCGMACQFNSAETVDTSDLGTYVQDALDLIEFANGELNTKWGRLRGKMGHAAPFHLKMMGIGNENWGPQYLTRLKIFTDAIHEKYPHIKFVNSSGTDPSGDRFDFLNTRLREMHADIIDEHYYRNPSWFLANARRYDNYPRNGSKVFAGEYAAQSDKIASPDNKNNWECALSEAAFMTGLERNAAVVSMASYAPLFAHIDAWQWTPDLIWFDNLKAYGTPNYYVQKLFSINKGTEVVPITLNSDVVAGQDSLYATACVDEHTNELIIKFVNASGVATQNEFDLKGVTRGSGVVTITTLKSDNLNQCNSLEHPDAIAPVNQDFNQNGNNLKLEAAPYSLTVIRIALK
ncbi:Alpha-L-arabinofuranosidase [Arachidicoccus rhizosphaerae]|uniref:non-reducing end alpha-L-arabinofuranosidase n=2 Tax=Arachidicoccus rhizosphaerae TaxID=551991 RepID=A0A1H3Y683_9BACT|nr:Alpha-L-arabinofuranosidase [Arachidicoccus rhizosphaerae]